MRPRRSIRGARAGLAALEFALVAPLLLTFFLGTIDVSNALIARRRLDFAARATAEIASTTAAQSLTQNKLTNTQAWQATTAAFALFPAWAARSPAPVFTVTLSAVSFTATPQGCTQGCSYTAAVTWSLANDLGQPKLRACGALASAPDTAAPSYTTLPVGDFGPTSLLVADISYTFKPMFFGFIIGDIPMMQSAYVSPRVGNGTLFVPDGGRGVAVVCQGNT